MVRLKNLIKGRVPTEIRMTLKTVTYTIPIGPEKTQIGHFLSAKIEGGDFIVLKFATQADETPAAPEPELFRVDFC